jgi:signal transduction histidine kinase/DNA-binding NarL/FixJ family response regulator
VKGKFRDVECYGDIVLRTKEVYSTEKWFKETDKYYDWQCVPILNDEGEPILIMERIKDVTINKLYEKALRDSKERAEEASRFKTKFIANVAHEIRTPMNGIVGIIDLLEDIKLSNKQKEYFNMLRYSAERLSIIINDVLDISKIESGKLEIRKRIFSMSQLLNDVERYFRIQAEKRNLKLSFFSDSSVPDALYGDADKLNQVLFNLLSNAIKFTEKGQICVNVEAARKSQELVIIKFSIDDTGIGIPQQQISRIFDDFYQVDSASTRKHGGSGLGLPISKKIVELMGGNISVESEYGKGSSFLFELSFRIAKQNERKEGSLDNANERPSKVLQELNVLVVEDENINQQIIKSFLERENCTVTAAANGKEALNILSRQCFDIILMDIYMPEIDGFELAKTIRESENSSSSYTQIIAITASVTKETKIENTGALIDSFITKPFTKQQLCKAIADTLDEYNKKGAYDLNPILKTLDGNQQLLADIINEIISTKYQEEFLGEIERYAKENDFENLAKQIHKFKGSISHFQVKSLNDILIELKECCIRQEFNLIHPLIDKLKCEYENLRSYLMEYERNKRL